MARSDHFRPALLLLASAAMAATAGSARAQEVTPFVFADQTPLVTSCADLVTGVAVEVRNETAKRRRLHVLIGRLADSSGEFHGARDVCGGLTATATSPRAELGKNGKAQPPLIP